jgi:hypothetical protein
MHELAPLALAALVLAPASASASAYRFVTPVAVQLAAVEAASCARPLSASTGRSAAPASQPQSGRCLSVDLTVAHREAGGRILHEGVSYLLEQGFAERIALDFGGVGYATVVLHALTRGLQDGAIDQKADAKPLVERALKHLQRHVHYEVLPNVVLPMEIELAVARLADRFHSRARCPLVITSGPRTPESQAFAMYLKINAGASLRSLYRNTDAAQEIRKAYDAGRRARKKHRAIIADMAEVIRQQMQRGVLISPHLKGGAVDIRSRTLNRRAKIVLQDVVARSRGMRLIREEKIPPHFHLEINP